MQDAMGRTFDLNPELRIRVNDDDDVKSHPTGGSMDFPKDLCTLLKGELKKRRLAFISHCRKQGKNKMEVSNPSQTTTSVVLQVRRSGMNNRNAFIGLDKRTSLRKLK